MELANFILENGTLALQQDCKTWQEAVKQCVDMLVKAGSVEPRYYDAILENTKKNGPYYLITDSVAMPHARPESGALKTGCALLTLKEAVYFEGDDSKNPIKVFVTIAAQDAKELNQKVLVGVMGLIENEDTVTKLIAAKTGDDLKAIFNNLE